MPARELAWEGCLNVRDLGGHPTEEGGETRFGRYVRAASLDRLTAAGWRSLVDYGVRTVVDLRLDEERAPEIPVDVPVAVVHRPLRTAFDHPEWPAVSAAEEAAEAMRFAYLAFLERSAGDIGAGVTAIAEPEDGAVVFHCMGGKDRTGLVSALLLRLAGVEADAVVADYAVSAGNLAEWLESWIEAAEDNAERRRRVSVCASPAEAMARVLVAVDDLYGGAEAYLRRAGVEAHLLARLRTRLVA